MAGGIGGADGGIGGGDGEHRKHESGHEVMSSVYWSCV
jgi:hypothetical protein